MSFSHPTPFWRVAKRTVINTKFFYQLDHMKKQENSRKNTYFCFSDTKTFDCVDHNKLWKTLKEMGIPDHLICLRNLYMDLKITVKILHGTTTGSKLGKEYDKAVYCHPVYLNYMQSTSCEMLG